MDTTLFQAKLVATTKHLDDAGREANGSGTTPFAAASVELQRAASSLEELIGLCQPIPTLRACPVCGKNGMAAATLCGYCWTKLTPVA